MINYQLFLSFLSLIINYQLFFFSAPVLPAGEGGDGGGRTNKTGGRSEKEEDGGESKVNQ